MTLVRKYGGSSLSTMAQIQHICRHLPPKPIVIVLSAPAGRTSQLYDKVAHIDSSEARNRYIALGEQESCLAVQMTLDMLDRPSEIIPYDKIGIKTDSLHGGGIVSCDPNYISQCLDSGKIAIVPGFQGVYSQNQLSILKRGASDDTAVALAIAMQASCEIYSNVPFIYDSEHKPLGRIDYNTLLGLITPLAQPMSVSAIHMAKKHELSIVFRYWEQVSGGTIICKEPENA